MTMGKVLDPTARRDDDIASPGPDAGAEVSFWRSCGRSGEEGSCTGWTMRDAITCANTGIPTIAIATENFRAFAHEIAAREMPNIEDVQLCLWRYASVPAEAAE